MDARQNWMDFVVGSVPTLFYIPDFITEGEQQQLLNNIYQAPVSKWKYLKNRRVQNWGGVVHEKGLLPQDLPPWLTRMTERICDESKLFPSAINHVLINEYLPSQGIMPHQDGPSYFPVVAILSLGSPVVMDFAPHSSLRGNAIKNNVEDKISAGAPRNETEKWLESYCPFSVVLMPRSLLIFKDEAYSDYLHGIKDCEVQHFDGAVNASVSLKFLGLNQAPSASEKAIDENRTGDFNSFHRNTCRTSLTCRVVSKVHKNLFKF